MESVGILSDPGQYAKTMRLNHESWLVGGYGARAVSRMQHTYLLYVNVHPQQTILLYLDKID